MEGGDGALGSLQAHRVPGEEGPSPQCQAGHELDGQAGAAVPHHHLGVAVGPGHVQDQVGPAGQGRGSQGPREGQNSGGQGREGLRNWVGGTWQGTHRSVCRSSSLAVSVSTELNSVDRASVWPAVGGPARIGGRGGQGRLCCPSPRACCCCRKLSTAAL